MTDRSELRTYIGPMRRGLECVPGRQVPFERGDTKAFTVDELDHLDPQAWVEPGTVPATGTWEVATGVDVPVGTAATLVSDGDGSDDLVLVEGQALGTAAEVLALAVSPAKAAVLLEHELAGRARKSLIAKLRRLAGDTTTNTDLADSASHTQEA